MWLIYKIINKVNGKLYIGLTTNLKKRWNYHLLEVKDSDRPLYQAMRKYGIENFNIEVIQENIPTEQEALLLESRYIKDLNTLVINKIGYNILPISGGRAIVNGKYKCSSCDMWKETSEFYKNASTISGLHTWCKECCKEYDTVYYDENSDIILKSKQDYWIENKEMLSENKKEYYQENKESISVYNKNYYESNVDSILDQKKDYYSQNKENILEQKRNYYIKNKDIIQARRKLKVLK